ncbi:MAG: germination protein YpeB [Clostridia bacterium]|nr:germination protein YpeB [Clostridia bacterium]
MNETFSKRALIRIVSFCAAVGLLILGAGISGYKLMSRYRNTAESKYQLALNNLADYVSNMKTTLEKGLYSNTAAQQQPIFAKLMTMSEGAKSSLSQLPISSDQAVSIQKYLGQVGDYSFFALSKIAKNKELSQSEKDNLKTFYDYACELDMSVGDMAAAYADGSVNLGKALTLKGNIEKMGDSVDQLTLDGGFREMNEGFTDYPTMIYDGPFSDHILQQKPKFLEGKSEVTEDQALTTAAEFAKCSKSQLNYEGQTGGNLPTYNFSGDNLYITVTKVGGFVNLYRNYSEVAKKTLSYNDAIDESKKFLNDMFKEEFEESYYSVDGNICTVNLAYVSDDVIHYSDLVKVGVNMQTGEIMSFCATGYIMNHTERDLKNPKISKQLAQQTLSKNLTVKSCKTALIPTAGKNEVLAYEFDCTASNEKVLVYINCETGLEEQIYIVLESDDGVLVM